MNRRRQLEWLVRDCEKGDANAFRMLFGETKDDLFRFIRLRVSKRDDALDILQETFTDLWQSFKRHQFSYRSDEEFLGFLCLIARRKIIKLYRHASPVILVEDFADVAIADNSPNAGEAVELAGALSKLEPLDREVMELHYYEGMTFAEIAGLLDKEENAVKVRHHRALAKLKEILGYEEEQKNN